MNSKLFALFIVALFAINAVSQTEPPAGASLSEKRQYILDRVNQERTSRNLPALYMDGYLNGVAQGHSADMASVPFLSHTGSDGSSPSQRAGFSVSENVAYGYSLSGIHNAWMNSAGHRANILRDSSVRIGIGLQTSSSNGAIYATQVFAGRDFNAFPLTSSELATAKSQVYQHISTVSPHLSVKASL